MAVLKSMPASALGNAALSFGHALEAAAQGFSPVAALPQARVSAGLPGDLLERVLDEIDYGVVVLAAGLQVRFANRTARQACGQARAPCRLDVGRIQAASAVDQPALDQAIAAAARRCRRSLVRLGDGASPWLLAVVPLSSGLGAVPGPEGPRSGSTLTLAGAGDVLVLFNRRQTCETLSVEFFARAYGLTHAETAVLTGLCRGESPTAIAALAGVAISTVRTQVSSIRQKTGTASIRDLVRQVAVLPPIVPTLSQWMSH